MITMYTREERDKY